MWTLDPNGSIPSWRHEGEPSALRLAFSTRRGGVSAPPYDTLNLGRSSADRPDAVDENRRRWLTSLGLDPACLATAGQVHGARVVEVSGPGHAADCDALVTTTANLALAISSADCLPILLAGEGVVAAVHAGWRGLAAGVSSAALRSLLARGGEMRSVRAHFGPCIRDCCYHVGPEVARRFPAAAIRDRDGLSFLDLATAARLELGEAGLAPDSIDDAGACTACEPFWCFSHRRDRGATGRHWAVIALDARGG